MDNAPLIALLSQLRAGTIDSIEFGHPDVPMGYMSHHRIVRTPTNGGVQIAFKKVHGGMLGSGIYLGDCDDAQVLAYSEKLISDYMRPSPNPAVQKFMESRKRTSAECIYFAIPHAAVVAA